MNRNLQRSFGFLMLLIASLEMGAQDFPRIDGSPMDMAYFPREAAVRKFKKSEAEKEANAPIIRVIYSRPDKKDRKIFGGLEEYGKLWRVGANESSEIMFLEDVRIDGQKVKAGRYTFYVKPERDHWEVFFSSDVDGWGAYHYNPDSEVASITVPTEKAEETIEHLSIVFEEADGYAKMVMGWDDTIVRIPIRVKR